MMSNDTADEDRILGLLERWDELRKQGRELSAEELCADCSELVPELKRRIAALNATNFLNEPPHDQ
jgi:hypothetical protein